MDYRKYDHNPGVSALYKTHKYAAHTHTHARNIIYVCIHLSKMSVLCYVKWLAMGQHEPFWWNFHWNGMSWLADWLVKVNGSHGSLPAGIVSEARLTVCFGKPKVLPFEFGLSWTFCGSFWEFNDIHVAFHTKKSYSTSMTIFDTIF